MSAPVLVRARGVGWTAPDLVERPREVLRDIDLELSVGERVGLVGPSGAGKTSLVSVLAGLQEPTRGTVEAEPGTVGVVFQEPERGFFEETVLEDVAFGPRNRGASREAARDDARDALRRVGLDPALFGGRAPETLSGGEARRAAIAGVLAFRPRVVLFDEPTIGLDADGVARFLDVFRTLAAGGVTVLLVSHDLPLVWRECERVLVLEEGRIAWQGGGGALAEEAPPAWVDPDPLRAVKRALVGAGLAPGTVPCEPEALAEAFARARG